MLKWIGLKDLKTKWTNIQNIRARDDQKEKIPKENPKKPQRNRKETAKKPQRNCKDTAKKMLDGLEMIESDKKINNLQVTDLKSTKMKENKENLKVGHGKKISRTFTLRVKKKMRLRAF